jgi:hypothetical protein
VACLFANPRFYDASAKIWLFALFPRVPVASLLRFANYAKMGRCLPDMRAFQMMSGGSRSRVAREAENLISRQQIKVSAADGLTFELSRLLTADYTT